MAQRDLSNFRTVINQVADTSDITVTAPKQQNPLLNVAVDVADQILRQGQEAKITEGLSEAQLKLNALQNDYQIKYEGDPMVGLEEYKQARQAVFDEYGSQVSPLFRRQWNDSVRTIAMRNDAVQQGWALKQTRVNTVNSFNKSMANALMQASSDGMRFGEDESSEINAFINMANVREQLEVFGTKNLGSETTGQALDTFDEDYMKVFMSGVSETNPLKALQLMETDMVKDHFRDPVQYTKMKKAIESRAKIFEKAKASSQKMNTLAAENEFIEKVGNTTYAEQQQFFEKSNASPIVREFYEEVSGYASQRAAVKGNDKIDLKRKFQIILTDTIKKEDVSDDDLRSLQDAIYGGMKKGVLSEAEGFGYIDQLMTPLITKKQEQISKFKVGAWNPFQDNLGLDTLQKEIEAFTGYAEADPAGIGADDMLSYKKTANQMYDLYLEGLSSEAQKRGMKVADLSILSYSEGVKVYNAALKNAKEGVVRSLYPSLATVETLPEKIISKDGKTVNTGLGTGKPVASVSSPLTEMDIDNMTEEELDRFLAGK